MKRFFKQIVYGFFYIAILGILGFLFYQGVFLREEIATCFDNIKNQDEIEVDCSSAEGGACITCELKNIRIQSEDVVVLPVSDTAVTLLLQISNPSLNYGLGRFDYVFEIFSKFGPSIRKLPRYASLYPGETKYLVESGININPDEVGAVHFLASDLNWEKASDLGALPEIAIVVNSISDIEFSKVVEGRAQNTSDRRIDSVIIAALGYNADGDLYKAATAELRSLESGNVYDFKIFLPRHNYKDIKVVTNILP